MNAGADRVILNTYAIDPPELLKKAVKYFGSSTIIVAIDYKKILKAKDFEKNDYF